MFKSILKWSVITLSSIFGSIFRFYPLFKGFLKKAKIKYDTTLLQT